MGKAYFILFFAVCCMFCTTTYGQSNKVKEEIKHEIDSLKFLGANAFDCNSVIWRIIAHGKDAVPYLIKNLSDTTTTNAKHHCKSTNLRVRDLSYLALTEIIPMPMTQITGEQFDVLMYDCLSGVFEYIEENKKWFQIQVQTWYNKNVMKMKWVKYKEEDLDDCYRKNHILGCYSLDWKMGVYTGNLPIQF